MSIIYKLVNIKSKFGNYSAEEMHFNDEKHFQNWMNKAVNNGLNIVGIFDLQLSIDCKIVLTAEQFVAIMMIEASQNEKLHIGSGGGKVEFTDKGDFIQYKSSSLLNTIIMLRDNKLTKWTSMRQQVPFYKWKEIENYIHKQK